MVKTGPKCLRFVQGAKFEVQEIFKQNQRHWPEFPCKTEKDILPMTKEVVPLSLIACKWRIYLGKILWQGMLPVLRHVP